MMSVDVNDNCLPPDTQSADQAVAGMIGLARRAGRLAVGTEACLQWLGKGKAQLLLIPPDAAPRVYHTFGRPASAKGIPMVRWSTREQLGRLFGRPMVSVVAVSDAGIARRILELLAYDAKP
ncbi:MAG TPA: L7Ae/L30e/S12e/Gadd45 family ribosomal protein [Acidobacteriota bacterium]|nr:L7Ae/L30e/S12e/Gadd45 family ribosomal protein [Acidobacteriota bacterium]HRR25549.1 L7Ae/L30e/S12e/Gadd45 family ribosomal protein [Acidobacteriota bacterium]HRR55462.1 L7Ae/L30e/S12e/Gadd45 family ribosomal protein [Acidobacteriota bacterium]HRV08112.1 L7Ae/L30e/S12e/Gadd45 family ribosomal protein [Acidobacteriota bacterium]